MRVFVSNAAIIVALAMNVASHAKAEEPSSEHLRHAPSASERLGSGEPRSPEATLRSFVLAMFSRDHGSLKKVALPHDDLQLLFGGNRLTAEQLQQATHMTKVMPLQRMKIGDEVKLPSGKRIVLNESHVNEKRIMIKIPNAPAPFEVVFKNDEWRVNATAIIRARKAVSAAARKVQDRSSD